MLANTVTNGIGSAILVLGAGSLMWLFSARNGFVRRLAVFQHVLGLLLVALAFAATSGSQPNYQNITILAITVVALILSAIATNQHEG